MADYINNVACGDNYTPALTIGPNYDGKSCVITVANNPVLMQFALGKLGEWRWTDEREFFTIPQSFQVGNVIGVRFRNANAGQVARVLAVLAGDDDPLFQSGMPFTGTLTAAGNVVPAGSGLTGLVNANGTVGAGTGFTPVRNAVGNYSVTFTTPFAAPPLILVTVADPAIGASVDAVIVSGSVTAGGFQVITMNSATGATRDQPFFFEAKEMV